VLSGYQPCLSLMGEMTEFNVKKITTVGQLTVDCRKFLVIQALPTGGAPPYDETHTEAKTSH
jgi:hypothetical protein